MIQAVDNRISIVRTSNIGIRTKIPKLTEVRISGTYKLYEVEKS